MKQARRVAVLVPALQALTDWEVALRKTTQAHPFVCFETVYAVTAMQDWSGIDAGANGVVLPKSVVLAMLDRGISGIKADLLALGVKP